VGIRTEFYAKIIRGSDEPDDPQRAVSPVSMTGSALVAERMTSFLYPGGSVAVHAQGRDRDAIWDALKRSEVYSTSGPRILLWLDLLSDGEDEDAKRRPMGSEIETKAAPRFEARAVGAFVQRPGCPDRVVDALGAEWVESLCFNECNHPSDTRHTIAGFEVVRVRPQQIEHEDVTLLIEDPWLMLACEPNPDGCSVQFDDPEHAKLGRDTVYYVRALQAPTPAINGANLSTRFADGRAVSLQPCRRGAGSDPGDDCLADVQERAWSSPIFVDYPR
jgi:hypothetical protein